MQHDIPLREVNSKGRYWLYYAFTGGAVLVALAVLFFAPILAGSAHAGLLSLAIIGFELFMVVAGLIWFGLLVTTTKGVSPPRQN